MPKIDNIEETPNPNAVKFILKEPLTHGTARSFMSAAEGKDDELAKALFETGSVRSVFYMDKMITVEKDDFADWDELLSQLAVPIRAAASVTNEQPTDGNSSNGEKAVGGALGALMNDDPQLAQINAILDERIRPYLMSDGGWLEILSLADHKLTIRYQGACGSCPSSLSGTLMAIEGMLKAEVDPELEVVAV